jgi:hypothetical protein
VLQRAGLPTGHPQGRRRRRPGHGPKMAPTCRPWLLGCPRRRPSADTS